MANIFNTNHPVYFIKAYSQKKKEEEKKKLGMHCDMMEDYYKVVFLFLLIFSRIAARNI